MTPPRILILRAAGINCDEEMAYAWQQAGARPDRVHINRLIEQPGRLSDYAAVVFPGGFSYGDDIAAGTILANQVRHHLADGIRRLVEDGRLALGVCNGFQVLVKSGLLGDADGNGRVGAAEVTIAGNDNGRFEDRWVRLRATTDRCVWLEPDEILEMPVAHGEGKVVGAAPETITELDHRGCLAVKYVGPDGRPGAGFPANPNGSQRDAAGLCDATGRIFGLMPHPERFVAPTQHPLHTRRPDAPADGARLFRRAVDYFRQQ